MTEHASPWMPGAEHARQWQADPATLQRLGDGLRRLAAQPEEGFVGSEGAEGVAAMTKALPDFLGGEAVLPDTPEQ